MNENLLTSNYVLTEEDVQKLLEDAMMCSAEMEVGEAARMILGFFKNLPSMAMFTDYVKNMDDNQKMDLDEFTLNLMVSLIMTLMDNYQKREKESAKA